MEENKKDEVKEVLKQVIDKENEQKFEVKGKKKKSYTTLLIVVVSILGALTWIALIIVISPLLVDDVQAAKPIIYLYPEEEINISVKLGNEGLITCSYPKYENEWNVNASPDEKLIDTKTGRELYSLYWEGKDTAKYDFEKGFCIKGEDTAEFLEEKLKVLGLSDREAEEFIVYWLPKMQNNKYNFIRFASTEEINEYMPLEFSKEPDTLIRVLMQYKPLEKYLEVEEQKLETPKRKGFVAVEWGGTEL